MMIQTVFSRTQNQGLLETKNGLVIKVCFTNYVLKRRVMIMLPAHHFPSTEKHDDGGENSHALKPLPYSDLGHER